MPRVDLVFDTECPNVALARANLRRAFAMSGLSPAWYEHRIGDPKNPVHVQGFGSPSVLIDGRDVAHVERGTDSCCRIYTEHGRAAGAPSPDTIAAALIAMSAPGGLHDGAAFHSMKRRPVSHMFVVLPSTAILVYAGLTTLLVATVWSAWPSREAAPVCDRCETKHSTMRETPS